MLLYKVPGVSITVFKNSKILWSKGYGMADNINKTRTNDETMFQAASISKAITAFAVLKLVEERQLDMDKDVNDYLRNWKIPDNEFSKSEKVTIRRLLNHTSGISVEGFKGYKKSDTIPSLTDILNGNGNTPAVNVESIPGKKFSYSGGGYLILQKLIEDITQTDFETFMKKKILSPLKMRHSTFNQFPGENVSLAHNSMGKPYDGGWFIMPELAPAGLWTTSKDLAMFCIAVQNSINAKRNAFLSQKMAVEMLKPTNHWGLGVGIRGEGNSTFFFHGGRNPGFNSIIINLFHQDFGIVIMTNGEQGGFLRDEIVRSFSNYYNVKLQPNPRIIRTMPLNIDEVKAFLGKYQWKKDYFLELSIDNHNELILTDLFDGRVNRFVHFGQNSFIDKNTGEEAVLKKNVKTGELSIFYNNIDTFIKVN